VNDLAIYDSQLPANIDVLSRFVLIGTEKLKAIKAEIRAINKADLARDVYDQKLKEQEILSGLILDASTKLGEFTVTIPKATAGRKEINLLPQGNKFKTKEQTANELGFSRKQVHQFETLAKNKDLVEQEKAQAAEEGRPASRAKVLELAKQRQKHQEEQATKEADYNNYLEHCHKLAKFYNRVLFDASMLETDEKQLNAWMELVPEVDRIEEYIGLIDETIPKLLKIKSYLERRLKR
jgi:hypothetical protein